MNSYAYITNPETGRKVNIFGKTGQKIINNYYVQAGGTVPPPLAHQKSLGERLDATSAAAAAAKHRAAESVSKGAAATKAAAGRASQAASAYYSKLKQQGKAAYAKHQAASKKAADIAAAEKAWQNEQKSWVTNEAAWDKMKPDERCYLTSLSKSECAEKNLFENRIQEIVVHLTAAHLVMNGYYSSLRQFQADEYALTQKTHKSKVQTPEIAQAKSALSALVTLINEADKAYVDQIQRAEAKIRRLPAEHMDVIKGLINHQGESTLFDIYPEEVHTKWNLGFDTQSKKLELTPPVYNLPPVVLKKNLQLTKSMMGAVVCYDPSGKNKQACGLPAKQKGGKPGCSKQPLPRPGQPIRRRKPGCSKQPLPRPGQPIRR